MKKTIIIMSMAAAMLTAVTGCKPVCNEWYEADGTKCVEMREKFYGTYVGVYSGNGQSQNGAVDLNSHSGGVDKLSVFGSNTFVLTGSNTFDIPLQNVYDPLGTYSMEGTGSLNGNQLIFNYVATVNGQSVVMNFTGTK